MKAVVKKISDFTNKVNWLFVLEDTNQNEFFIMTNEFYNDNSIKNPVTKRELDQLDAGMTVDLSYLEVMKMKVVTKITW
jgi:hypothetical protein